MYECVYIYTYKEIAASLHIRPASALRFEDYSLSLAIKRAGPWGIDVGLSLGLSVQGLGSKAQVYLQIEVSHHRLEQTPKHPYRNRCRYMNMYVSIQTH